MRGAGRTRATKRRQSRFARQLFALRVCISMYIYIYIYIYTHTHTKYIKCLFVYVFFFGSASRSVRSQGGAGGLDLGENKKVNENKKK